MGGSGAGASIGAEGPAVAFRVADGALPRAVVGILRLPDDGRTGGDGPGEERVDVVRDDVDAAGAGPQRPGVVLGAGPVLGGAGRAQPDPPPRRPQPPGRAHRA